MEFNEILKLLRSGKLSRFRRKSWPKGKYCGLGIILISGGDTKLMNTRKLSKLGAFTAFDWEEYKQSESRFPPKGL